MKITARGIGVVIAYILLASIILGVPYAFVAFYEWKPNPGTWDSGDRLLALVLVIVLGFLRYAQPIIGQDSSNENVR